MFNDIKLMVPDFFIECSDLKHYNQVYPIFREHGITKAYTYVMAYRTSPFQYNFLKCGMSHPDLEGREYQVGERVCRQISHLPGWKDEPISDHGNDFYNGVKRLIKTTSLPEAFNKDNLLVGVWDITKRFNSLSGIRIEREIEATEWAEGELCSQYKRAYGSKPALNYRDPSNSKSYKKGYILDCVAAQFPGLYD